MKTGAQIQHLPKDEISFNLKFSEAEFWGLLSKGAVVDGRKGGVVICPNHKSGMPLICRFRNEYFAQSKVHDGEFIMTQRAFTWHWPRIFALEKEGEPSSEVLSDLVPVIDCSAETEPLFILIEIGQLAIKRRLVERHLGELIRLNHEALK